MARIAFEYVDIEKLIPYARNSRKHSPEQVSQVAASIKEFGFLSPVVVDKSNNIVAGHCRVLAARKLGLTEIPCVRAEHLTDIQRRAYVIADNKLALNAEWDNDMLKLEFEELKLQDFNLDLTGFDVSEVSSFLRLNEGTKETGPEPELGEPKAVPEKRVPVLKGLMNGDCLEKLKELADNSIDAIVTDPPYGLGSVKDLPSLLKSWMEGKSGDEHVGANGFMGKEWDKIVPSPLVWKECLRVLKPGGHMLVFAGTRTQDLMGISIRLAGAELRDEISYFGNENWVMGSGFPKSLDVSKAIDEELGLEENREFKCKNPADRPYTHKEGETSTGWQSPVRPDKTYSYSEEAKKYDGYGSAIKPAHEPALLFRKGLSENNIAANVMKWGTGGLNIDGTRIAAADQDVLDAAVKRMTGNASLGWKCTSKQTIPRSKSGRFPANVVFSHHPECKYKGKKEVGVGEERVNKEDEEHKGVAEGYQRPNASMFTHKVEGQVRQYGKQLVDDYECHEDCPVRILSEQSGVLKSGDIKPSDHEKSSLNCYGKYSHHSINNFIGDKGTASRFFYCAKASKKERNAGLDVFGKTCTHPTVKPIKLMTYLVRLVTPEGGTVLDPFMGSGTTGCACALEGFDFIGIEREKEYFEIANVRIAHHFDLAKAGKIQEYLEEIEREENEEEGEGSSDSEGN